jgi:hypothetical protein
MENSDFTKEDSAFDETSQMTNKWIMDTCSIITSIYNRQLKTTLDFYRSVFNSIPGANKNGHEYSKNFIPAFFSGNDFLKSMFLPFKSFNSDQSLIDMFNSQFEDILKQASEFNTRLFYIFQEEYKNKQVNWNEFNKIIDEEWKNLRNITTTLHQSYTTRLNHSPELTKKLLREINNQFEMITDRNKKMWAELINTLQVHEKAENASDKTESQNEPERKYEQTKKFGKSELAHH